MVKQRAWDKFETALLASYSHAVLNHSVSKKEAVATLSNVLRNRAIAFGEQIDATFRNENGISMQMCKMTSVMSHKATTLSNPPQVFYDIVELYENAYCVYDVLLRIAKGERIQAMNLRDQFFVWLTDSVPSTQISSVLSCLSDINSFCKERRILTKDLFETDDLKIVAKVSDTVNSNKVFRFTHILNCGKCRTAISKYYSFLKEYLKEREHAKAEESPCTAETDTLPNVKEDFAAVENQELVSVQDTNEAAENVTVVDSISVQTESAPVAKPIILKNRFSLLAKGTSYVGHTPALALVEYCNAIAKIHPSTFSGLVDAPYNGRGSVILSSTMKAGYYLPLDPSINFTAFVNHDLSIEAALVYAKWIGRMCGEKNLPFELSKLSSEEDHDMKPENDNSIQADSDLISTSKNSKMGELITLSEDKAYNDRITVSEKAYEANQIESSKTELVENGEQPDVKDLDYFRACFNSTKLGVSAEDVIYSVLKKESERNPYGTTLEFVASQSKIERTFVKKMLDAVGWASCKYGRYKFVAPKLDSQNTVDFTAFFSYAGSTPISVTYFEEPIKDVFSSWAEIYFETLLTLSEDYPKVFQDIALGVINAGTNCIVHADRASTLHRPVEFMNGIFADIPVSATKIVAQIKLLLRLCNIDYENLVITYTYNNYGKEDTQCADDNIGEETHPINIAKPVADHTNQSKVTPSNAVPSIMVDLQSEKKERLNQREAFYVWLRDSQGYAISTCRSYVSAVKFAEDFARNHNYQNKQLFTTDVSSANQTAQLLREDKAFLELNDIQHHRFTAAITKYLDFLSQYTSVSDNQPQKKGNDNTYVSDCGGSAAAPRMSTSFPASDDSLAGPTSIASEAKSRYTAILNDCFVDGFRPTKAIDRNRFRMYYSEKFGEELSDDDEQLINILKQVGTLRDERIFVKDKTEQKGLLEEINDLIEETLNENASCIYLECLFTKYQEQLAKMLHIYSVESLENVLFNSGKRGYAKRYNYIFSYNKEPSPSGDVIEHIKKSHMPITYNDIRQELWFIPLEKIKYTIATTPSIVNVAPEAFLFAQNLPVSETELSIVVDLIKNALLQRSYISDVELMHLIDEYCPSVRMNTPDYPVWGLRNALAYLLRDSFSFRGAIISEKDEEFSMAEVFTDFCRRSEHLTVDELKHFASELNTVIYWDSVYSEMVRISQSEFVHRDQIHFDIDQTDSILSSLIQSTYVPIKMVNLFLMFPAIEVPWNSYVLESYVGNYSGKFRLLHAGYTATDCCGAIACKESEISDYRALVVDVLAKSNGWKTQKDALQLLVDLGYQQRRSYSEIEKAMQEAKARMNAHKK